MIEYTTDVKNRKVSFMKTMGYAIAWKQLQRRS